ncbi:lanthionine synthetase LanC family protein [Hymenobacter cheonanensis]|uniref:lanthionine synthetase LanC family protein n=1 Tax=Hymenobacter sp. CA2-7 TaxID=3063993 RepID=UPI0027140B7F|nr:lanthionine synthetase LanC family protein [Hymenobacter sp. CA2-7]MDO7888086.1 lanthionine synthetase LanC family protein [Hymenobacter sp. CA2-7]
MTAYYFCVSQAFTILDEVAPLLLQQWQQLAAQLAQQARLNAWPAHHLDQACTAAWLAKQLTDSHLPAAADHLLPLDAALLAQADRLHHRADHASRGCFFRILRYFSLRLMSTPDATALLRLLEMLPQFPAVATLGLADGLAAELLLLLRLHKTGIQHAALLPGLRSGVARLLNLRQQVDFSEGHYNAFPYHTPPDLSLVVLSGQELSWRHGDVGQSLLLYKFADELPNSELLPIAELVGLNTLLRTSWQSTQLTTSQVGQGTAGLAYLYQRLHRLSGHAAYRKGAAFWLERTHSLLQQELAAGFYHEPKGDIMHGLVGVGLVLLSSLVEEDLAWDSLVL